MRAALQLAQVALLGALLLTGAGPGCGPEAARREQVVVIGLDGATWTLLQPWIDRGDLPVLARLQREGAWGRMRSSIPYLSPPAWTTAVTGVNPGKHGIFDFQRRIPGQVVIVNETAKSRRAQPIWKMLQRLGRRSLILNIPMTDPPDEIDGLFVSGFPHSDEFGFAYPPELEASLGDYELDRLEMRLVAGREDSLLEMYARHRDARVRLTLDWLAQEPFDLLWVVFTGTDRIQHTFWKFTDPENPTYDPQQAARYGEAIHDFWVAQDRAIGEILGAVDEQATVFLVSDHGFGPMRYDLRLAQWLRAEDSGFTEEEALSIQALDPADAARVYVMRRGRDPGARWTPSEALRVRDRLAAGLRDARDPATGEKICEMVWTNEQVFSGTYAEKGPDIVALPAEGYFLTMGEAGDAASAPVVAPHGTTLSGWHLMDGIYVASGSQIAPGCRDGEANRLYALQDVVPTLLYLLGAPIPDGLDGRLMEALIDPQRLASEPPTRCEPFEEDFREETPEDLRNLRNLPYIGG
jgi:predicted AlkP superfamily phosphohydrolase/phosphomutase